MSVQRTVFENGLKVVSEQLPHGRACSFAILVDASPEDDPAGKEGLAHVVEHMMFAGTSHRDASAIARVMDCAGGQMGGFTTRDYTCYTATVLDDYLPYAIDLFGDLLLNSIYPEDSLERQKYTILREIAMLDDDPQHRVQTLLKQHAWSRSTLGLPVAGKAESVSELNRDDVIHFVAEHYPPDRITIVGAGRFEHDDFIAQVRDAFWRMIGESSPRKRRSPEYTPAVVTETRDLSASYFAIGIPAPRYADESRYLWHTLSSLLGGGMSSRLFRSLREEHGLTYYIGTEYHAYREAGLFVIEGCTEADQLPKALELIGREIQRLAEEAPPDLDEMWKIGMQFRGQQLLSGESPDTRVSRLATQELYFGRSLPETEVLDSLEAVSADDVAELVRQRIAPELERATIAVVGPESLAWTETTLREALWDATRSIP